MSDSTKQASPEAEEVLEFRWGKKRGIGGVKKEVQFYGSFVFDGLEYNLYDCVYLYKDGEPEPYVAKLIKIWEHPGNVRKVKVLWFFRPSEIVNHFGDDQEAALQNELFLATGDGVGLANINPLEAIAGKCNVICTSKDIKNPQPSEEEMKTADYVFYRTFNVDTLKISDKIDEKIATVEDKFIYNRAADGKHTNGILGPDCGKTEVNVASKDMPGDSAGCAKGSDAARVDKPAGGSPLKGENEELAAPEVIQDSLPSEAVISDEAQAKLSAMSLKRNEPDSKTQENEKGNMKPANGGSREADMTPTKKPRVKYLRKRKS